MSRLRPPTITAQTRSTSSPLAIAMGALVFFVSVMMLGVLSAPAASAVDGTPAAEGAAGGIRLGVVPFGDDLRTPPIATRLADALERRSVGRLLGPGTFVAEAGLEPSADHVRTWAYQAAVENLVVGRIVVATEFEPERIELAIRSGHSGARHRTPQSVTLAPDVSEASLDREVETLAAEILSELGYTAPDPGDIVGGIADDIAGAEGSATSTEADSGSGRGLENALALEGFDNQAPIEIQADEAEIVSRDQGRELVFTHNVLVKQANVILRSDRLEATYKKGQSEPERLVAEGRVFVDQGGRKARCDRAIYLRADQRLTCIGHAELVQGCDIVRGQSIRFDLADDRARVEGAASIVIRPDRGAPGEASACGNVGGLM